MSARTCPYCGKPAPYGYGLRGYTSEKPEGKRGYLWVCKDHMDEAEARMKQANKER